MAVWLCLAHELRSRWFNDLPDNHTATGVVAVQAPASASAHERCPISSSGSEVPATVPQK